MSILFSTRRGYLLPFESSKVLCAVYAIAIHRAVGGTRAAKDTTEEDKVLVRLVIRAKRVNKSDRCSSIERGKLRQAAQRHAAAQYC